MPVRLESDMERSLLNDTEDCWCGECRQQIICGGHLYPCPCIRELFHRIALRCLPGYENA